MIGQIFVFVVKQSALGVQIKLSEITPYLEVENFYIGAQIIHSLDVSEATFTKNTRSVQALRFDEFLFGRVKFGTARQNPPLVGKPSGSGISVWINPRNFTRKSGAVSLKPSGIGQIGSHHVAVQIAHPSSVNQLPQRANLVGIFGVFVARVSPNVEFIAFEF